MRVIVGFIFVFMFLCMLLCLIGAVVSLTSNEPLFPFCSRSPSEPYMAPDPTDPHTYRIVYPETYCSFDHYVYEWGLPIIGAIAGVVSVILDDKEEWEALCFSFSLKDKDDIALLLLLVGTLIIGAFGGGFFGFLVWELAP